MNRMNSAWLTAMGVGLCGIAAGSASAGLLSLSQPTAAQVTPGEGAAGGAGTSETGSLNLDASAGVRSQIEQEKRERSRLYGQAGSRWWTVGGLYAFDFEEDHDVNLHGAFSQFLADDVEFAVEAGVWYFNQPGEDTGGVSGSMVFRWHFWHADDYDWSVFADVGIGLLAGLDSVPDGGSSFNFLPRAGLGFTKALTPERSGPRLMVGVRWHHISNARIFGDDRNPARDSLAVYAGVTFAF
jgi:hypothetical protein